jgi:hypothetical protein
MDGVVIEKGFLQVRKLVTVGQAFHGEHIGALNGCGENETRANRFAVQEHRASAALTDLAAAFRAGEPKIFTQEAQERPISRNTPFDDLTVYSQPNRLSIAFALLHEFDLRDFWRDTYRKSSNLRVKC